MQQFSRYGTGLRQIKNTDPVEVRQAASPDWWPALTLGHDAKRLCLQPITLAIRAALKVSCLRGLLIGNTDWHCGNISLVLVHGDWQLSPICDMLPMLCMPIAGEVVAQELGVEKMVPTAHTLDV